MNLPVQDKPVGRGKRIFLRAVAALTLAAALFLTVCSNPGSGTETPNRRYIYAKWEIADPAARFASIELTEAEVYIVIERGGSPQPSSSASTAGKVPFLGKAAVLPKANAFRSAPEAPRFYTGNYTILGDSTVYLAGFGTLEIDLYSNRTSADIRLQLDSGPAMAYEFNVERAVDVATSANTDLLCRHWNYARFLLNGELWEPWEEPEVWEAGWEFPESKPHITNLFSKAGTYLQTVTVDGVVTHSVLGHWRWVDGNENAFYYTGWMDGSWQTDIVNIVTLTETAFAIRESLNYGYVLTTEFELLKW